MQLLLIENSDEIRNDDLNSTKNFDSIEAFHKQNRFTANESFPHWNKHSMNSSVNNAEKIGGLEVEDVYSDFLPRVVLLFKDEFLSSFFCIFLKPQLAVVDGYEKVTLSQRRNLRQKKCSWKVWVSSDRRCHRSTIIFIECSSPCSEGLATRRPLEVYSNTITINGGTLPDTVNTSNIEIKQKDFLKKKKKRICVQLEKRKRSTGTKDDCERRAIMN